MVLIELIQEYGPGEGEEETVQRTFRDFAILDADNVFFNLDEFGETHSIDGREMPAVYEIDSILPYASHWEAGAKQNFDNGLYNGSEILYVRVSDYGAKPKSGKAINIDGGMRYIKQCEEEIGVYRMTLQRHRL